ncbi:serine/threonine protein kinase [Botrimarina hoheduenensis]|uniref:Serine/threonine-protein kinase PknB n=1 Tax=Botrimarina hoheduenensis TaxID=2528000 RepID=A0A5C5WAM5_9BACT|nr:serine/threonine-protein kinase [Botrimarina hoheduenensis]TWT46652.1 Serine/threonine-protein kinase PknB [Botrimarina hoheduenensis]
MAGLGSFFKSMLDGGKVDITSRYEILRDAVSGTMSDFHKARDRKTKEIVGVKILDMKKTDQLESRFRGLNKPSEGQIATSFDHPYIVKTFSYGTTSKNEQFLVMEFLDGPGLNSVIIGRDPRLKGNRLTLMRQAAEALEVVHAAGYIHRDVCPRNFVCNKEVTGLKLIDFGLTVPAKKEFMQPGIRTGTPNYMAPEVVRRKPTDHRIDIFAFGASMYEMFAFDLPWIRGTDGLAAMSHGTSEPPPLRDRFPTINPELERIIMQCLSGEPTGRPASMSAILNQLKRIKQEEV